MLFIDNYLLKCIIIDAVARGTYKRISTGIIIYTTCPAVHGGDGTSCHEVVVPVFPLCLCSSVPLSPIDIHQAAEGERERGGRERGRERGEGGGRGEREKSVGGGREHKNVALWYV